MSNMLTTAYIGYAYFHFPMHVWDARMSLIRPGADYKSPSHEAILQFASSMSTEGGVPSFCAYIAPGQFVVEAVLTRRIFENVANGVTSRLIELQNLDVENFHGRRYNFRAKVRPEAEMIDSQRLWWEVVLETESMENEKKLRRLATSVVEQIDGVGVDTIGPWGTGGGIERENKLAGPALLYDDLGRDHLERMKRRV